MQNTYLSPDRERVPLLTEADLDDAVAGGLLEESHFLDLKREVKPGKGENKETARDLAQFAVDSGTVIIGTESVGDPIERAPQPLVGLPERLESIAASIPGIRSRPAQAEIARWRHRTRTPARCVRHLVDVDHGEPPGGHRRPLRAADNV